MVTDLQVRRLFKYMNKKNTLATVAAKAGMDEKTDRKYRRLGKFPSEFEPAHDWSGHADAYIDVWDEILQLAPHRSETAVDAALSR